MEEEVRWRRRGQWCVGLRENVTEIAKPQIMSEYGLANKILNG